MNDQSAKLTELTTRINYGTPIPVYIRHLNKYDGWCCPSKGYISIDKRFNAYTRPEDLDMFCLILHEVGHFYADKVSHTREINEAAAQIWAIERAKEMEREDAASYLNQWASSWLTCGTPAYKAAAQILLESS